MAEIQENNFYTGSGGQKIVDRFGNPFKKNEEKVTIVQGYDLDGTLSFPNKPIPVFTKEFLKGLHQNFGVVGVFSSGKSASYLEKQAEGCHIFHWFAENHAVCQEKGKKPQIIDTESLEDLVTLREIIGLDPTQEGVSIVKFGDNEGEVFVEKDKLGVLTLFTQQIPSRKIKFNENKKFDKTFVKNNLEEIIQKRNLRLTVMKPHSDGGIDIIRLDKNGKPLDKSSFVSLCQKIIKGELRFAFFGDGTNDIPAWNNSDVYGITFPNATEDVIESVKNKGKKGYISDLDGPEGGVCEAVVYLATEGFYGKKQSNNIELYGRAFLEDYKKQKVIFV